MDQQKPKVPTETDTTSSSSDNDVGAASSSNAASSSDANSTHHHNSDTTLKNTQESSFTTILPISITDIDQFLPADIRDSFSCDSDDVVQFNFALEQFVKNVFRLIQSGSPQRDLSPTELSTLNGCLKSSVESFKSTLTLLKQVAPKCTGATKSEFLSAGVQLQNSLRGVIQATREMNSCASDTRVATQQTFFKSNMKVMEILHALFSIIGTHSQESIITKQQGLAEHIRSILQILKQDDATKIKEIVEQAAKQTLQLTQSIRMSVHRLPCEDGTAQYHNLFDSCDTLETTLFSLLESALAQHTLELAERDATIITGLAREILMEFRQVNSTVAGPGIKDSLYSSQEMLKKSVALAKFIHTQLSDNAANDIEELQAFIKLTQPLERAIESLGSQTTIDGFQNVSGVVVDAISMSVEKLKSLTSEIQDKPLKRHFQILTNVLHYRLIELITTIALQCVQLFFSNHGGDGYNADETYKKHAIGEFGTSLFGLLTSYHQTTKTLLTVLCMDDDSSDNDD